MINQETTQWFDDLKKKWLLIFLKATIKKYKKHHLETTELSIFFSRQAGRIKQIKTNMTSEGKLGGS